MPEFVLDLGLDFDRWKRLDTFTQGYIEAMYWTSASTEDDGDLNGATFAELAPNALDRIIGDCLDFVQTAATDLDAACLDEACDNGPYDMRRAGCDFWLTRNGHGAGFWDRGLGEIGERLSALSRPYGSVDLYRGDDGLIYVS